LVHINKNWD